MTMNFNFRLQKVLDIRMENEEKSKLQFKEAMRDKNSVEEKLNSLKIKHFKHNIINGKESLIERKIKMQFLNALNENIEKAKCEFENKCVILEEKREDLKNKQIQRKSVEILKDKQKTAFIKEQNLIEQKNNDEFALYGHIRRINEGR